MNVQYAIKDGEVYVLEVNPRASRTVPYVSKATGVPAAQARGRLDAGQETRDFEHLTGGRTSGVLPVPQCFVKSPVFPFGKFPGVDPALGPEMRSTGEVMGVGENFGEAFGKAQLSAGTPLPDSGTVFISVNDRDKAPPWKWRPSSPSKVSAGRHARHRGGFESGRAEVKTVFKVNEGRPNAVDHHEGRLGEAGDLHHHRRPHVQGRARHPAHRGCAYRIPCITTISGAKAAGAGHRARALRPQNQSAGLRIEGRAGHDWVPG
jgi:carbamoyl-phosphate synthase large subunit